MLVEVVAGLLALLFFLNLYLSWNDNYWLKRDIPFIEPIKGFGNIKDVILLRKTIGEVYTEIYRKLEGKPLGGFFKLRTPILMLRDPNLIGRVLKDDFKSFHDNDIQIIRDVDPIFRMNPFVTRGATWKSLRSVLTPCENPDNLKFMAPLLTPICVNMVEYIKSYSVLPVEVKELSGRYTTDIVASLVFGFECDSFRDVQPKFREMTGKLFNSGLKSKIALLCAFYAPGLGNIFKFRIIPKNVAEYFIEVIKDTCKRRVKDNIKRDDFLQQLININKESEAKGEGTVYNYSQIAAHCITFLTAGYYTSASTLCFCLYELARNPDCQKLLRNEILSESKSLEEFDYEGVERLNYLRNFVSESLRLHPPIQAITRVCTRAACLEVAGGPGVEVAEGTPVVVPIQALHRDPAHFKDPDRFLPERFSPHAEPVPPNVYLPFGTGPRACLGEKFAMLQVKLAVIAILLNFEVELRDDFKGLKVDPQQSLLTTAQGDVRVLFKALPK